MFSSYGQVRLNVVSLPFFGITFQNCTYTFFLITLLKYLLLSRQKISGRLDQVKISSNCTFVVLAHCLVHGINSVSNLRIESVCFVNSPISPSFTFENFQSKSLCCGSNLNEGIAKETGDFFSLYYVGLVLPLSEKNNNIIQETEGNFCLSKHRGRAQS